MDLHSYVCDICKKECASSYQDGESCEHRHVIYNPAVKCGAWICNACTIHWTQIEWGATGATSYICPTHAPLLDDLSSDSKVRVTRKAINP